MTNRLTRARAHGLRPFFIGASIPLRSMDGGAFSFVHAREHQVVDALARAAQDTGAEVRGYTTAQAMHIQITGAACHRDRLIVLLQRHIREVCQSPAPNAEAISDVLRELRATSEWDLSSRRLERWLLRGGRWQPTPRKRQRSYCERGRTARLPCHQCRCPPRPRKSSFFAALRRGPS